MMLTKKEQSLQRKLFKRRSLLASESFLTDRRCIPAGLSKRLPCRLRLHRTCRAASKNCSRRSLLSGAHVRWTPLSERLLDRVCACPICRSDRLVRVLYGEHAEQLQNSNTPTLRDMLTETKHIVIIKIKIKKKILFAFLHFPSFPTMKINKGKKQ